jgi:hypothetical protein
MVPSLIGFGTARVTKARLCSVCGKGACQQRSAGAVGQEAQPATDGESPSPVGRIGQSKLTRKNYTVGLEISCPGGGYYWALDSQRYYTSKGRAKVAVT